MHPSFDAMQGIILAAGKSSRFGTGRTKVLEPLNGQPMLLYSVNLLNKLGIKSNIVVGYQAQTIQESMARYDLSYCLQPKQKGTAHALLCSQSQWHKDYILVMNADMPLIDQDIITQLYVHHIQHQSVLSFVVAHNTSNRTDYGRVVERDGIKRIIEACDFKDSISDYPLINAGIYLINRSFLSTAITHISNSNNAQEFYITDLVQQASIINRLSYIEAPFEDIQGVNTLEQLQRVETLQMEKIINNHMRNGVRFDAPVSTRVDYQVTIEPGAHIGVGVHLLGTSFIGSDTYVGPYCIINHSIIEKNVHLIAHNLIKNSRVSSFCCVGPFSHIEGNSSIGMHSIIGSFVHINRSILASGVKAKHLAYLGDAQIQDRVNVGAGVITANYDGYNKHTTTIGKDVFLGSNTTLVAPLQIEESSFIAAGSTITHNVEAQSLAIARSAQINKVGYAPQLRTKKRNMSGVIKKHHPQQSL